ncbi:response regulator transcription factor [Candidatus Pacebacteria bacterium]|nr:response regulator transcription factor [Candidatus Paceibacterota bacterium]
MRVLLVEDEESVAFAVTAVLKKEGVAVDHLDDGYKAYQRLSLESVPYDIIILDLLLSGMPGLDICRYIRSRQLPVGVVVLSAIRSTATKVELFKNGADDYISKPVHGDELLARLEAIMRRTSYGIKPIKLRVGDLVIDKRGQVISYENSPLELTKKEYLILAHFIDHIDEIVSRKKLAASLWDEHFESSSNVIDVHIRNLRRKLSTIGSQVSLVTVRGSGYRLSTETIPEEVA